MKRQCLWWHSLASSAHNTTCVRIKLKIKEIKWDTDENGRNKALVFTGGILYLKNTNY